MIARAVYVDARTSGNWFVMSAMAAAPDTWPFGIGEACHYPMIVIPEMFNKTPITIDKIIRLMVSSIVKRRIVGMDYGAAVISEGVFHELSSRAKSSREPWCCLARECPGRRCGSVRLQAGLLWWLRRWRWCRRGVRI